MINLRDIIDILDKHNLKYVVMGEYSFRPWLVYPSPSKRLWEIDINLGSVSNHFNETSISIKANPDRWGELNNAFEPEDSEYYINTIEEFKEHFEELLFATNAYNILHF